MTARLGLGTVQFGLPYGVSNLQGQVSSSDAREILDLARRAGVDTLDTASAYGEAESVLCELIAAEAGFRIISKTAHTKLGMEIVTASAYRSIERLGPLGLDTLLVHSPADLPVIWPLLTALKDRGRIRKIGFSAYVEDNPRALAQRFVPDVVQVPLSLFDQRLLRDGTLDALRSEGIEIHVRSIFLQGLLLMSHQELPKGLESAAPYLTRLSTICSATGRSIIGAALDFALSLPQIDIAIVGVTSRDELAQIIATRPEAEPLDWESFALTDPNLLNPARWTSST